MNNFKLLFVGDKAVELETAIKLGFSKYSGAEGWLVKDNTLYLYWHIPDGDKEVTRLPFKLTAENATFFVSAWLKDKKPLGHCPGIDGSVDVGFEIQSEAAVWRYHFLSIRPVWALYGK